MRNGAKIGSCSVFIKINFRWLVFVIDSQIHILVKIIVTFTSNVYEMCYGQLPLVSAVQDLEEKTPSSLAYNLPYRCILFYYSAKYWKKKQ